MSICLTTGNQLDTHSVGGLGRAGPPRLPSAGVARTFLPRHRTQKQFDAVR